MFDYFGMEFYGVFFELLNCGGSKCIAGSKNYGEVVFLEIMS